MMDLPQDIIALITPHLPAKSSTSTLKTTTLIPTPTQLSHLISDGTLISKIIHATFPKMVDLFAFTKESSTKGKETNYTYLNTKILTTLNAKLTTAEIRILIDKTDPVKAIFILRQLVIKIKCYMPIYKSLEVNNTVKLQNVRDVNRHNTVPLHKLTTGPGPLSSRGGSEYGDNDSLAPPSSSSSSVSVSNSMRNHKRIQQQQPSTMAAGADSSSSRRLSRLAAGISAGLNGSKGDEVILGSKGRRLGSLKREEDRLNESIHLRNGTKVAVKRDGGYSIKEIDAMFNRLSGSLSVELEEKSVVLDRLDLKSKQFDVHMNELRKANINEMIKTEKNLDNMLRIGGKIISNVETNGTLDQSGSRSPSNSSIVSKKSVLSCSSPDAFSPPPPPPPLGPPPDHILKKFGKERIAEDEEEEEEEHGHDDEHDDNDRQPPYEDDEDDEEDNSLHHSQSEEDDGEGDGENNDSDNDKTTYSTVGLHNLNISTIPMNMNSPTTEVNMYDHKLHLEKTPEQGLAAAKARARVGLDEHKKTKTKTKSKHKSPKRKSKSKEKEKEPSPETETNENAILSQSPTLVNWCQIFSSEYNRHYFQHHSGVSRWNKPTGAGMGWCQVWDEKGRVFYEDLENGGVCWTAPFVRVAAAGGNVSV